MWLWFHEDVAHIEMNLWKAEWRALRNNGFNRTLQCDDERRSQLVYTSSSHLALQMVNASHVNVHLRSMSDLSYGYSFGFLSISGNAKLTINIAWKNPCKDKVSPWLRCSHARLSCMLLHIFFNPTVFLNSVFKLLNVHKTVGETNFNKFTVSIYFLWVYLWPHCGGSILSKNCQNFPSHT